jgi:P-type Ca2+ transporter type 2C
VPGWKQFLAQYRSYIQIILVAAAVASILIGELTTGIVVLAITTLNALGGMRQQGKAENAMNALQSMLKASARVRRDGAEIEIDADHVVVGDVVLLAAGDDVSADGRIVQAASLQIDESGLTGESVPASKTAPVGIALGLDKETPGLMKRKPPPARPPSCLVPSSRPWDWPACSCPPRSTW